MLLRAFGLLLATLSLFGCVASTRPCEEQSSLPVPYGVDAWEPRKAESPVAIAVREAPAVELSPKEFAEDRWGAAVFDDLPPRAAPELSGDAPARGGTPLVCHFDTTPKPGIDGVDDIIGRPFIQLSTPDLLVWADFAGTKITKGPAFFSTSAIFTFRATLRSGDPVLFEFGDFDLFSANDYIGRVQGSYPGKVPFDVRGPAGVATCRAALAQLLADEAKVATRRLDTAVAAFEAYSPTVEDPIGTEHLEPINDALGAVVYFTAEGGPAEQRARARVTTAAGKQWTRYLALLQAAYDSAPPAGQWVPVAKYAEARVAGLRCLVGDRYRRHECIPALELRIVSEVGGALCPAQNESLGELGPLTLIQSDGQRTTASLEGIRSGDDWLSQPMALTRLLPGAVLRLQLRTRPTRESPTGWDLPLLRVGNTYLRVH